MVISCNRWKLYTKTVNLSYIVEELEQVGFFLGSPPCKIASNQFTSCLKLGQHTEVGLLISPLTNMIIQTSDYLTFVFNMYHI